MSRFFIWCFSSFLFFSSASLAMERHFYSAAEVPHDQAASHGILILGVRGGSDFRYLVEYNTDTFSLNITRPVDYIDFSIHLKLEESFAELLPDYYKDGVLIKNRGFSASYQIAGFSFKTNFLSPHYIGVYYGKSSWRFSRAPYTSSALTLPVAFDEERTSLTYTYWSLSDDPSWYKGNIFYPSPRGFAFGYQSDSRMRSSVNRWGAIDSIAFSGVDQRNNPEKSGAKELFWLMGGSDILGPAAIEWYAISGVVSGGDDIDRFKVGGLNPYVIPLGGLPWAGVVTDRLTAGWFNLDLKYFEEFNFGFRVDTAYAQDIRRTGDDSSELMYSYGLYTRYRGSQISADFRVASATVPGSERSLVSLYSGIGFSF